jgi:2'-5' RNA ligase
MLRLFIAIPLPTRVQRRLAEESDRLRLAGAPVRWVGPENLHITLRFLGEVAEAELLGLIDILKDVVPGVGGLELVARGLGAYPSLSRPRVVWCGVTGRDEEELEELQDLYRRLDRELGKAGFRRDRRSFAPHVTLGRVRGTRNLDGLIERLGPSLRREFAHFSVKEIVLFESHQGRQGSVYTPVQTVSLA